MKLNEIKKLARLANELDALGKHKEADKIDSLLQKSAFSDYININFNKEMEIALPLIIEDITVSKEDGLVSIGGYVKPLSGFAGSFVVYTDTEDMPPVAKIESNAGFVDEFIARFLSSTDEGRTLLQEVIDLPEVKEAVGRIHARMDKEMDERGPLSWDDEERSGDLI